MIAQKLKNNYIAIGQNTTLRDDALEVIYELRVGEFYRLSKATNDWVERLADKRDIMFVKYDDENAKICKEFDKILSRRKLFVEKQEARFSEEEALQEEASEALATKADKPIKKPSYPSPMIGTSRLLRIPSKQIIKICKRKGKSDNYNKQNSVCISNECRELFFSDVKKTEHFKTSHLYELLNSNEDANIYNKWDAHITKIYEAGLEVIDGNS